MDAEDYRADTDISYSSEEDKKKKKGGKGRERAEDSWDDAG